VSSVAFNAKPSRRLNRRDVKQSDDADVWAGNGDRGSRVCCIKTNAANLTAQWTVEATTKAPAAPNVGTA
jgi:hypothetical protein